MKNNLDQNLIQKLKKLKYSEEINLSSNARDNIKIRIFNQIVDAKAPEKKESLFFAKPKFAFKTVSFLSLSLLILSTGTILAAQSANPNNPLYAVKLASENAALNLAPTPFKANIAYQVVKRRESEVADEEKTGNKNQISKGLQRYKDSINSAKGFVSHSPDLSDKLKIQEDSFERLSKKYEDSQNQSSNGDESKNLIEQRNKEQEPSVSPETRKDINNQSVNEEEKNLNQNIENSTSPLQSEKDK